MIDYPTFHRLRQLRDEEHLSVPQIAQALGLDERTVGKWITVEKYQPRKVAKRPSKLDPFKSTIVRLLAQHPFSAQQLLQRLKEGGYTGGYQSGDSSATLRPRQSGSHRRANWPPSAFAPTRRSGYHMDCRPTHSTTPDDLNCEAILQHSPAFGCIH